MSNSQHIINYLKVLDKKQTGQESELTRPAFLLYSTKATIFK
jgi:hypothetical protein